MGSTLLLPCVAYSTFGVDEREMIRQCTAMLDLLVYLKEKQSLKPTEFATFTRSKLYAYFQQFLLNAIRDNRMKPAKFVLMETNFIIQNFRYSFGDSFM